jgi:hypothetical protein
MQTSCLGTGTGFERETVRPARGGFKRKIAEQWEAGLARIFGTFGKTAAGGIHGGSPFMEDRMDYQSDEERLVAEQAALHYRELKQVMKTAPHGKGMAVMEQAVREKGFEQMRQTLSLLANAHDEAQKKGQTVLPVRAAARPTSNAARTNTS